MPTPNAAPVLTDYLSLGFNPGEDESKWRKLTVSRADSPKWLTIPWDAEWADAKGQHYDAGGWTILQGPCSYALRIHARCKLLEPGCSTHIQGYTVVKDAAGVQTIASVDEGNERFVGQYETSHTHVDGVLTGVLNAGEFLQARIDYWNAGRNPDGSLKPQTGVYGYLVGATVRGFWGPLPVDVTDTI